MDKLIEIAGQSGPMGLIILAFGWYIVWRDKRHQAERKEQNEAMQKQHDEVLSAFNKNTETQEKHITVLTRISAMIEGGRRKG